MSSNTYPDEVTWLERARGLSPLLKQSRDQGERERQMPVAVFEAIREAGFFRMWLPKRFGGFETNLECLLQVGEEVAREDAAAAWNLIVGVVHNLLFAYLPQATAEEILAANPGMVIAGAGNATGAKALPVDGGYLVSGTWALASGCQHADWFFGASLVLEEGGPRLGPGGFPEPYLFLFPRSDGEILDTWHSIGLRGTGSHHIRAHEVFVPEARRLALMSSQAVQPGALYSGSILDGLGVLPIVSLGIARAAIDAFAELATSKTPTLGRTMLGDLHTTQERVGRAEMLLGAARAYVYEVAREIDAVRDAGERPHPALIAKRRLANVNAVESAMRVVDLLYAVAGTSSIYEGNVLERCARDVRTVSQHLVAAPSNVEMVGQYLLTGTMAARR